jgi:AGZA family xanthine/uracil permease-like MFS transporter
MGDDRPQGPFERLFQLSARGATVRGEVLGGVTTFMTMSYIVFVNASILSDAGMPVGGVMVATCLGAALATVLMGLLANLPVALAPGMGMNALVAYTICIGMKFTWPQALGMVFWAGALFMLLSVFRFRERVIAAIPRSLKLAAASGIGLFIAFIGLQHAGLVVAGKGTLVEIGSLRELPAIVACAGLLATCILLVLKVRGAILLGLVATAALALATGLFTWKPDYDLSFTATMLKLDLLGALSLGAIPAIVTLLFFDLFDTVGTLMGVGEEAGLLDEEGRLPNAGRALASDAAGSMAGALFGTTTVTSYIESAAGVAAGARTGLSNLVVAALFLLSLPLLPFVRVLGDTLVWKTAGGATLLLYPITAPALIVVGFLMAGALRKIEWDDYTESLPAFLTVVLMPMTFSISAGLAVGLVSYVALKLASRTHARVHPLLYVIAGGIVVGYAALGFFG